MLSRVLRYYHTLKYLHWIQIKYRLIYKARKVLPKASVTALKFNKAKSVLLKLDPSISAPPSCLGREEFQFLNIRYTFTDGIDWNIPDYGKLWTYNLNYFEFLSQPGLGRQEGLELIRDFIEKEATLRDGKEPFPTSLRAIFWIKFIVAHQIREESIDQSLYRQLELLSSSPEYHLMGNHLLENGFSLLFGACYFENQQWLKEATEILEQQLEEQILEDGAHFELSPMYHQIILYRILDCINLLQNGALDTTLELRNLLRRKAARMLGWMAEISFADGTMPRLNDSSPEIAPSVSELLAYAHRLSIPVSTIQLSDSGYRKRKIGPYEFLADVGNIGPDYIPGHAHSDTFNFVLHYRNRPIVVDTGISTYEKNARRNLERSTASHNTVMVGGEEQSEVWGGFRVARRAKITRLEETESRITATHNGYQRLGCIHQRNFTFEKQAIHITDTISSNQTAEAFLHFHPDIRPQLLNREISVIFGKIKFENELEIRLQPYLYAVGFNRTKAATKAIITFKENLHTIICLE